MAPKGRNSKVEAAMEKKAAKKASKDAQKARQAEKQEAEEWKKGSNARAANRKEEAAAKADEAARQRQLKAELLAAEEAEAGNVKIKKSAGGAASKKKSKKKKDDLSLLEDALVSAADKKSKAKKRAERLKKEEEERRQRNKVQVSAAGDSGGDPLLSNTDAMIGNESLSGRQANVARMEDGDGSGIDGALKSLSVGGEVEDAHPEKRMKALHKAFEERMMPEMKEQYPGLKMSQYKEKIFNLWKKSSDNPMNQQRPVK
mmetsp:Transcript_47394/g.57393  ORF Transcript_47394/g.57393 Transcript_47394/m.57393 type:complete len:259 (+) Transcript_47394:177-953(+)|eukprot:CAMPEP_0172500232 /NCGR_PEP_ID=MMETSP1066-20121228/136050_1 /TAXON_ID=671091 /ORGANISM="Coscinodiscus wailesii, Strain CCMP2513" /LENGTH=258 /DNA_ID=CAMNT_0013274365 /DNA_START=168 /DNA_END=944 /DNA_ORIENTATION=+